MFADLSITATWAWRFGALGVGIWIVVAVIPWAVLRRRAHRSWFQRTVIAANLLVMVISTVIGTLLIDLRREVEQIPRERFGEGVLAEEAAEGEPVNFLLVGIDQAAGLADNDPVMFDRDPGSDLTDTIMILRVIPDSDQAHLLSFPRDLWVELANGQGPWKINEAMKRGGPELLINTIRENFGIEIHHYIQVNFLGFRNVVQVAGGVPIYLPNPIRDKTTGLYIDGVGPLGGCVTLDPEQALAFVRSRNYEWFDQWSQRWVFDPSVDFGRISRQQLFLRLAVEQAINQGARDPARLRDFLNAGGPHVVLDETLTIGDLVDLGSQLSDFDSDHLKTYQLPTVEGTVGEAAVLHLLVEQAQDELNVFKGVSNAIPTLPGIRINVRNGSGRTGEAIVVAQAFQSLTLTVDSASDADRFAYPKSVIRYRAQDEKVALLVAGLFAEDVQFEIADSIENGATLEVVTGADFTGLLTFGNARPQSEFEHLVPSTTTSTTSTTTTTVAPIETGPVTTTTVLGAVPDQRESCL